MVLDGLRACRDAELQLAGVAAETGQQRVAGNVGRRVVVRRSGRSPGPATAATRSHSAGEGCGSHRWTSRCSASATTTSSCAVVSRVGPNSDSRPGRSTRSGSVRSRWQAGARRSAGLGRPTRPRTCRHSSACQRRSSDTSESSPSAHDRSIDGRCAPYESYSAARWRAVASRRPVRCASADVADAEVPPERRAPLLRRALVDGLQQRPDQPVRLPRIVVGLDPRGTGEGVGDQRRRVRESDVGAHAVLFTGDVPSTCDSRWVTHRSTPLAGTATTSGANGSAGGSRSTSASPSTSRSARSDRCRCSTGRASPVQTHRLTLSCQTLMTATDGGWADSTAPTGAMPS